MGEKWGGTREERRTADFLFVAFEDAVFFHCADVEDTDCLISGGAGDHVTVWRPGEGLDRVLVVMSVG